MRQDVRLTLMLLPVWAIALLVAGIVHLLTQ